MSHGLEKVSRAPDIGQGSVPDPPGYQGESRMLGGLAPEPIPRPGMSVPLPPFGSLAFEEFFDGREYELQEYRLRARPSAPDPAVARGGQENQQDEGEEQGKEQWDVLGPEIVSEHGQLAPGPI